MLSKEANVCFRPVADISARQSRRLLRAHCGRKRSLINFLKADVRSAEKQRLFLAHQAHSEAVSSVATRIAGRGKRSHLVVDLLQEHLQIIN